MIDFIPPQETIWTIPQEAYQASLINVCECQNKALTDAERDRIWREWHFTVEKMNSAIKKSKNAAEKIKQLDVKRTVLSAIAGLITGIATRNVYGVLVSGCLNTIANITTDASDAYYESVRHMSDADYYAWHADELQDRLWRDK